MRHIISAIAYINYFHLHTYSDSPNKTALVRSKFKEILCLGSDRAKSLIKFSKDAKIKSIAELYHLQQSVVRVFRYAFASKRKSLQKQKASARRTLDKLIGSKASPNLIKVQEDKIAAIEMKNTIIDRACPK